VISTGVGETLFFQERDDRKPLQSRNGNILELQLVGLATCLAGQVMSRKVILAVFLSLWAPPKPVLNSAAIVFKCCKLHHWHSGRIGCRLFSVYQMQPPPHLYSKDYMVTVVMASLELCISALA